MSTSQWGKACSCVVSYLETPVNVDRLAKSAQVGVDSHPNSDRVTELKVVGSILRGHHAAGTNPVNK